MPEVVGPHLLGRSPSEPDHRDKKYMAVDALHAIRRAAPPLVPANLKQTLDTLYKHGHFRTQSDAVAVFRFLKAHYQPPVGPGPAPTPTPPTALRRRVWNVNHLLDQLDTPHCIGFGGTHWGLADPVNDPWTTAEAHALYYRCKVRDGEPKAENGSTVRSLAEELQAMGRIANYVWCARVDETGTQQGQAVADWLLHQGPVILGTNWYQPMFQPDTNGVVHVGGTNAGGHCYLAHGIDLDLGKVKLAQSWGPSWGVESGHFYMPEADLQRLLDEQGEALATLELPLAA